MAKAKSKDSQPEKIEIKVGPSALGSRADSTDGSQTKKARDKLWTHGDMDGGFADEMKHTPGQTVHPVDLSVPESDSENTHTEQSVPEKEGPDENEQTVEIKSAQAETDEQEENGKLVEPESTEATETDEQPQAPEPDEPEPEAKLEPEPVPAVEEETAVTTADSSQTDAIYQSDDDFYSSKLNANNDKPKPKRKKKTKTHHQSKYLNPRFVFILTLFITTLIAGVVMLVYLEKLIPGSSLIFENVALPWF